MLKAKSVHEPQQFQPCLEHPERKQTRSCILLQKPGSSANGQHKSWTLDDDHSKHIVAKSPEPGTEARALKMWFLNFDNPGPGVNKGSLLALFMVHLVSSPTSRSNTHRQILPVTNHGSTAARHMRNGYAGQTTLTVVQPVCPPKSRLEEYSKTVRKELLAPTISLSVRKA